MKSLLLLFVLVLNYILVDLIPIQRVDWSSFFPQSKNEVIDENWFDSSSQYLFIELEKVETADKWLENSKILNYYSIDETKNLFLLIFDRSQQNNLLQEIKPYLSSGTSIVGLEIMKNFTEEVDFYLLHIVPFMLFILFIMTSLRYWLNMLLEIATFHLLLVSSIFFSGYSISAASLLALIFLIIYAFTLFNYLHSGEIKRSNLAFGIVISIVTTALSSLFLFYSKFGLISSFGSMMLIGLSVLFVYSLLRLYFIQNFHFPFSFADKSYVEKSLIAKLLLSLFILLFIAGVIHKETLNIDLNPVNLIASSSNTITEIRSFEEEYIESLPLVLKVSLHKGDFTKLQRAKELNKLLKIVSKTTQSESLSSLSIAYRLFAEDKLENATQESYAQFMLALEMMNSDMPIFSTDFKSSYITMTLPLESSTNTIASIVQNLELLEKLYPNVNIEVMGKIADLGNFSYLFLKEFTIGLSFSILFVFIFFIFYCKTYRAAVVIVSTLFSLLVLLSVHAIFSIEVTIMTLLSVILFAGLVTDSIVHIFICYKENGEKCFESVTKPIVLSNLSMLVGLIGMLLSGSLMQHFGFELSVLISANLLFILYIMPYLLRFKKYTY